jgi:sugar phosphate isomerase/epimerase
MRIGMVTNSLGHLPLDDLLRTAAELGIEMLEGDFVLCTYLVLG